MSNLPSTLRVLDPKGIVFGTWKPGNVVNATRGTKIRVTSIGQWYVESTMLNVPKDIQVKLLARKRVVGE